MGEKGGGAATKTERERERERGERERNSSIHYKRLSAAGGGREKFVGRREREEMKKTLFTRSTLEEREDTD